MGTVQVNTFYFVFVGFHYYFLPSDMDGVFTRELIEYSVATNDNEVMVVFDFKSSNIRVSYYNVWVSFILCNLCFNVSYCL